MKKKNEQHTTIFLSKTQKVIAQLNDIKQHLYMVDLSLEKIRVKTAFISLDLDLNLDFETMESIESVSEKVKLWLNNLERILDSLESNQSFLE